MFFKNLSDKYKIIIIVGAPILNEVGGVEIGLFIIRPYTTTTYYSKMHLHEGKTKFFSPGKREIILDCKGTFTIQNNFSFPWRNYFGL